MSIKAGMYDVVLAVGVEQMGKGLLGGAGGEEAFLKKVYWFWNYAMCLQKPEWNIQKNMELLLNNSQKFQLKITIIQQ